VIVTQVKTEVAANGETRGVMPSKRFGLRALQVGSLGLFTYLFIALVFGRSIGGFRIGRLAVIGAVVLFWLGLRLALSSPARRPSPSRMLEIGMFTSILLFGLLGVDLGFAVYQNSVHWRTAVPSADLERRADRYEWHGEIMPRRFSANGLQLYKPNTSRSAYTYGDFYHTDMLASRTLTDSVLELHRRTYLIGPHGLRELKPLTGSHYFALGDSFVMGYSTEQDKTWTVLLGKELGETVYNLGLAAIGPGEELRLLRDMLEANRDSMKVQHLLWMIFEGNDLEDPYTRLDPPIPSRGNPAGRLFDSTIVDLLASAPARLESRSVLRQLLDGNLRLGTSHAGIDPSRFEFDGVRLSAALYRSPALGYQLFNPVEIDRATKPLSYVLRHPNRARLDRTFEQMDRMSHAHGFDVTVIVAPTSTRLEGPLFDGFPTLSPRPFFIDYVLELARQHQFATVNLLALMGPFAAKEPLYYRDDHHWNERGHALAAELIGTAIRDSTPRR
jgi:SGNH hydrolase-like domain, acetyltransferase AlgX